MMCKTFEMIMLQPTKVLKGSYVKGQPGGFQKAKLNRYNELCIYNPFARINISFPQSHFRSFDLHNANRGNSIWLKPDLYLRYRNSGNRGTALVRFERIAIRENELWKLRERIAIGKNKFYLLRERIAIRENGLCNRGNNCNLRERVL